MKSKLILVLVSVLLPAVLSGGAAWAYEVDLLWEKAYGGIADDYANELLVTPEGNIVVVGTTLSFGSGNRDVYLLKTDSNGTLLWDNTFGTSQYEYGNTVASTTDNGFVIAGWKSHEPWINYATMLMIKVDFDGNEIWTEEFAYDSGMYAKSVIEAFDSNYIGPLGPMVEAFEREFAEKVGIGYALAVSSGTAAMHLESGFRD